MRVHLHIKFIHLHVTTKHGLPRWRGKAMVVVAATGLRPDWVISEKAPAAVKML